MAPKFKLTQRFLDRVKKDKRIMPENDLDIEDLWVNEDYHMKYFHDLEMKEIEKDDERNYELEYEKKKMANPSEFLSYIFNNNLDYYLSDGLDDFEKIVNSEFKNHIVEYSIDYTAYCSKYCSKCKVRNNNIISATLINK